MIIVIVTLLIIIYLITLNLKSEKRLEKRWMNIFRIFLLFLAPLLIATLILENYNIYPRSYWFKKIIFWLILFLMITLYGVGRKENLFWFEKLVYRIAFYFPIAFIPLILIPFLGIALQLQFYTSFIGDKSFLKYTDDLIRIEVPFVRFLSPDPPLEIYRKSGMFSYKDTVLPIQYSEKDNLIEVTRQKSTHYLIKIRFTNSTDFRRELQDSVFQIDLGDKLR